MDSSCTFNGFLDSSSTHSTNAPKPIHNYLCKTFTSLSIRTTSASFKPKTNVAKTTNLEHTETDTKSKQVTSKVTFKRYLNEQATKK